MECRGGEGGACSKTTHNLQHKTCMVLFPISKGEPEDFGIDFMEKQQLIRGHKSKMETAISMVLMIFISRNI